MNKQELLAILTLLEDPDTQIFEALYQSFMTKGVEVVPDLERAWEISGNAETQGKLEDIIHKIQLNFIHASLASWVKDGAKDLLEGAYVIAKYQYPDLVLSEVMEPIDKVMHDALQEINDNLTALEKVRILNHIFYDIHKFSANTTNYNSPQNAYVNQVIVSKKGNPVSLGIIYASIAQKLGLPIYGVNLPKNFLLAYKDEFTEIVETESIHENILFYINPFNHGAVLGRKEIDVFLSQQGVTPDEGYYQPCSNVEIIQRLVLNLIYAYEKLGYEQKILDLQTLLKIAKHTH